MHVSDKVAVFTAIKRGFKFRLKNRCVFDVIYATFGDTHHMQNS